MIDFDSKTNKANQIHSYFGRWVGVDIDIDFWFDYNPLHWFFYLIHKNLIAKSLIGQKNQLYAVYVRVLRVFSVLNMVVKFILFIIIIINHRRCLNQIKQNRKIKAIWLNQCCSVHSFSKRIKKTKQCYPSIRQEIFLKTKMKKSLKF